MGKYGFAMKMNKIIMYLVIIDNDNLICVNLSRTISYIITFEIFVWAFIYADSLCISNVTR